MSIFVGPIAGGLVAGAVSSLPFAYSDQNFSVTSI